MSVFDGEIDFRSVTMVDFGKKDKPLSPRCHLKEDNCLIVGISRDPLKARDVPKVYPDKLCPLDHEYYKRAVERFKEENAELAERYLSKDIDPVPIENDIIDGKRTEYLIKYCSRDLPFMSVNLARRAKALQTLRLPDDIEIPCTSQTNSYRPPAPDKYKETPASQSMRPKYDDSLQKELTKILRIRTGDSCYTVQHGLLAKVIQEECPYGKPRKEPRYGRWKDPLEYTYRI